MLEKVASFTLSRSTVSPKPLSRSGVFLVIFLTFLAQIAIYYRSFGVKPASDDFPVVKEIQRGNAQGPSVFFKQSMSTMHHRPFKSLGIWAFGNLSDSHPEFWIRVLHFLGMVLYIFVLGLWISELGLSAIGTLIAAVVLMFHPALPQALSSIDGVDSIASSAFVWLGAYFIYIWRERLAAAVIATVICFILAAGWKEYSFAIIPLASWTSLAFSSRHRWRNAFIFLFATCAVFGGILIVRQHAIPAGYGTIHGANYASISPVQWIQNAAVIVTGLFFYGDSIWVFVHQSSAVLAMVAGVMLVAIAVLLAGLWLVDRNRSESGFEYRRWLLFLFLSFVAASFPVNIMGHVSEMYLVPLFLPLALLWGMSAEGWRGASKSWRVIAGALACIALISSANAIYQKVEGLRDVGQRADRQLRQVLALVPPDAHDAKVALVFDYDALPPRRTYAVYRMGDETLITQPMSLDWLVPDRRLVLEDFPVGSPDLHPQEFAAVLKWNYPAQQFERMNP